MTLPNLTRSKIQDHTTGGSFERGEEYLADGAVRSLKRTDDRTLKGQVQGGDVHPYLVTVKFDENDVTSVRCTCPYFEGSWCKHIVAVLLKTVEEEAVPADETAEVDDLVEELSRRDLIAILERLVEHDPGVLQEIRQEHARLTGDS